MESLVLGSAFLLFILLHSFLKDEFFFLKIYKYARNSAELIHEGRY